MAANIYSRVCASSDVASSQLRARWARRPVSEACIHARMPHCQRFWLACIASSGERRHPVYHACDNASILLLHQSLPMRFSTICIGRMTRSESPSGPALISVVDGCLLSMYKHHTGSHVAYQGFHDGRNRWHVPSRMVCSCPCVKMEMQRLRKLEIRRTAATGTKFDNSEKLIHSHE